MPPIDKTKPVIIFTGSHGQLLEDQITIDGRPYDLTGASVTFRMRNHKQTTLKVDSSGNISNPPGTDGKVQYDWVAADLDTPGEYLGWWKIVPTSGDPIEVGEFFIIVAQHAPGQRTRTGEIARLARSYIPNTWDSLENSPKYGDSLLQDRINATKIRLFGTIVAAEDEEDYNYQVIDFAAKLSVLSIIPAGIDYWMDRRQTVSSTGTNETVSYPDRIDALWKIHERLAIEVAEERAEIEAILGTTGRSIESTPGYSDGITDGFKTPIASDSDDGFFDYAFPETTSKWWE